MLSALSETVSGELVTIDFGLADYRQIWDRQKVCVIERAENRCPNTLLIGEHLPVLTLGRGSHRENLGSSDIPAVNVERGGDVTYHGPGQIVAYPIVVLSKNKRDLHAYLRLLEAAVMDVLSIYGLLGLRNPGYTGIWVQHEDRLLKVCAIGVAIKRWVTYHGLSLNVDCDLAPYQQINPCGLASESVGSLAMLLKNDYPDVETVKRQLGIALSQRLSEWLN